MRTDIKIGIVLSVVVVGVAAYYFSQPGDNDVRLTPGTPTADAGSGAAPAPGGQPATGKPASPTADKAARDSKPAKAPSDGKPAPVATATPPKPAAPTAQTPPAPTPVAAAPTPSPAPVAAHAPKPATPPPASPTSMPVQTVKAPQPIDPSVAAGLTAKAPETPSSPTTRPASPPPPGEKSSPTVDITLPAVKVAATEQKPGQPPDALPTRTDRPAPPANVAAPAPAVAAGEVKTHVVEPGDTFSSLAVKYYGHARYARFLMDENKNVSDPRALRSGATLRVPPLPPTLVQAAAKAPDPTAAPKAPGTGQYLVKEKDTFYQIAARTLGDGTRWPEIYELNRDLIGETPTALRAGQVLDLPKDAKPAQ